MYFYFMGIWLSARFTHAACEKAEKWINKVENDKQDPFSKTFVAHCIFVLCLSGDKACGTLIDLSHLRVFDRKIESRRSSSRPCWAALTHVQCTFLTIFSASIFSTIWFATMSSSTPSSSPKQSALYQALPSLAEVSKFSPHACSTARTHLERLKTARRIENSEAANLADFALCCCNA